MTVRKVYVIKSDLGPVKVGVSAEPEQRRRSLEQQAPGVLTLVHSADTPFACAAERLAHDLLAAKRRRGEWFDVTVEEAVAAVNQAIEAIAADDGGLSTDDSVPRSIRFPRDLLEELQKRAEAEHRSFNNYVVMKLRQMVEVEKRGKR